MVAHRGRRYLPLGDDDLISLVEGSDAQAVAALYDRHSRAAYSLAYRMMGERQAAEDLVQYAGEGRGFGPQIPAERGLRRDLAQLPAGAGARGPEHPPAGTAEDPGAGV